MMTARKTFIRLPSFRMFNAPIPAAVRRPALGGAFLFLFLALGVYDLYEMRNYLPVPLSGLGNAGRQLLYMALFLAAFFTLRLPQDLRQLLVLPSSMILMLAWCWISSTWAVDFSIAIRRLTLTTITFWTLFLCVEHAGYERTIRMMRWLLLITLVIDYMNVMVSPLAIETASDAAEQAIAGSWRGIQAQKNFAGAVCAILILLYLFGPKKSAALSHTVFKWGVIAAAAYFLHRTNSKTSMGVLAISILLGMVYSAFGSRNRLWLIPLLGSATLLAGILAVQNSQTLYDPAAFTGRSQIWLVVLHYIREHLWLGSGFGTFWNIGSISPVYHYTHSWVAKVASGHNGYLDLVAQIGLPGFVLTMIAMVLQPVRILLSNTAIPSQRGALLVAIFFFCIGHNFTESTILTTSVILELILVIVLALIFQAGRAGLATAIEPVPAPRGYAQIASPRLAR